MAGQPRAVRRAGKTRNVSVSLDAPALEMLRARATAAHGGNLSAAIAEAAAVLHRHTAREDVARELVRGRKPLTDEERRSIDAELAEGWTHARRHARKRRRAA